jgi:hypothetical protein
MKINLFGIVGLLTGLSLVGCSMNHQPPGGGSPALPASPSLTDLSIKPEDWLIEATEKNGTQISTRRLKPEKLEFVKKNFHAPTLSPVTVPESNGFEIYEIRGYKELESSVFVHPKVYINTGSTEGSILGYKTGMKDDKGNDIIEISIPVALVNGMVADLPTVSNFATDKASAIHLPSKYVIPDLNALQIRVGKKVETLPVCPEMFKLTFQQKEYWAKSPFEGLSTCPLNQFFRIKFQAPADEMGKMLETAAIRSEAVNLVTHLAVVIDVPKVIVEVRVAPETFQAVLMSHIQAIDSHLLNQSNQPSYLLSDLEEAVGATLIEIGKTAGLTPHYGSDILSQVNKLTVKYFNSPSSCKNDLSCSTPRKNPFQAEPIQFSWMDSELLVSPLETETVTALGAVANSSSFSALPSRDQLTLVRRPEFFKGVEFGEVVRICSDLLGNHWPVKFEGSPVSYGTKNEDQDYFKEYCYQIVGNTGTNIKDVNQFDGYYPLGKNTVVYPGAWLKLDIENIEELTTAKTRTDKAGHSVIESEVIDILAANPQAKITQCTEGAAVACAEYEKVRTDYRDPAGNLIQGPCQKGTPDCTCSTKEGIETCTRGWFEVLDFECDAAHTMNFCPYWRTQEDVVDYDIEYECHDEKVNQKTTFLCIGGCKDETQMVCKEKKKTPVKVSRQHLNCKEDDPLLGIAHRENYCTAPQYKCKKWESNCKRYNVNESFRVVHEEIVPKWRPFNLDQGEYPKRFEQDLYLKFVSGDNVVSNCRLDLFPREYRGDSIYIKLPEEKELSKICDQPLWNESNTKPFHYPKVYIKNVISYEERRLCGITEYSLITDEIPFQGADKIIPPQFSYKTVAHVGPVEGTCRADNTFKVGDDLWFTEIPPVRVSGRVAVLGKMLESIVTEVKP